MKPKKIKHAQHTGYNRQSKSWSGSWFKSWAWTWTWPLPGHECWSWSGAWFAAGSWNNSYLWSWK